MTLKNKRFGGWGEERQRGSGVYETRSRKYYAEVKVARVRVRETRSRKYYAEVKVARVRVRETRSRKYYAEVKVVRVGVRETRRLESWIDFCSIGKLA